jgi:hypothetical protein
VALIRFNRQFEARLNRSSDSFLALNSVR